MAGGFLRLLAEMLPAEGAPAVAIDPVVDNHRARRAYASAGFVEEGVVDTEAGPSVLMVFRRVADGTGTQGAKMAVQEGFELSILV